jgi:hypothetical protein
LTQNEVGQPSDVDVEEADIVVWTAVSVNHFYTIGPRVLAQAKKLCGMTDGVRGLKDGVLQPNMRLACKINGKSSQHHQSTTTITAGAAATT